MKYIDIFELSRAKTEEKASSKAAEKQERKDTAAAPAKKKKLTYKEQKEFEALEKELADLAAEKSDLEARISSGSLQYEELQSASERIGEIISATEEKELRWLELAESIS